MTPAKFETLCKYGAYVFTAAALILSYIYF